MLWAVLFLALSGNSYSAEINLRPPLDVLGISGMRKLATEIGRWPDVLSKKGLKTAVWSFILQSDMRKAHMFSRFLMEARDMLGWKGLQDVADQVFACDEVWIEIRYELKNADAEGTAAKVLPHVGERIAQLADREELAYKTLTDLLSRKE